MKERETVRECICYRIQLQLRRERKQRNSKNERDKEKEAVAKELEKRRYITTERVREKNQRTTE